MEHRTRPPRLARLIRWLRRDEGSASVEFVVWLPFIFIILALIVDVSVMLHRQTAMLHAVQDASRAMATGRLEDTAAVVAQIEADIANLTQAATVTANLSEGRLTTQATVPASELMILDFIRALDGLTLSVQTGHLVE